MKCEILTVAYDKDLERLKYQYESYLKFCKGFDGYTVIIDDHENDCVETKKWLDNKGVKYKIDTDAKHVKKGYVRQQFMKLNSDDIYEDPDIWVVHVDCDSMFTRDFHSSEFFTDDGKVIYWRESYESLVSCEKCDRRYDELSPGDRCTRESCDGVVQSPYTLTSEYKDEIANKRGGYNLVGAMYRWHHITSTVMGEPIKHEYMRRMPLLYKNKFITRAKQYIMDVHNKTTLDYLKDLDNFSEYNFLGAMCRRYFPHDYSFESPDKNTAYPFKQLWSHGDMNIRDVLTGENGMSDEDFKYIEQRVNK